MEKKLILGTIFLLIYFMGYAQKMVVESMEENTRSIEARTEPRKDGNDEYCALLKVHIALDNVVFEGNVIDVVNKTGEYWVYMTQGSKRITVKSQKYLPLDIEFSEFGIKSLNKETTYVLVIDQKEIEKESAQLLFKVKPKNAKLLLDNYDCPLKGGGYSMNKPVGSTVKYEVMAPSYISRSGEYYVATGGDQTISIELLKYRKVVDSKFFLTIEGGFSTAPQGSLGVMLGGVRRFGGYFKMMGWGITSEDNVVSHTDLSNYYFLNGEHKKKYLTFTGGMLFRLGCPLHLVVGAGYGKRAVMYQTFNEEWIADDQNYAKGVAVDMGGLLLIKGFSLHLGMSSIKFKYIGAELGVGFNL